MLDRMRHPLASPGRSPLQRLALSSKGLRNQFPATVAVLLGTSALAFAQGLPEPGLSVFVDTEGYDLNWPSDLGSGAFTSGCVARTLDGAHPDAFIVRGGTLVHLAEAGQFDSFQNVATQVGDVTSVSLAGQQAGTDGIAFVGVSGVHFGSVSPVDSLLDIEAVDLGNTTGIQVRAADVNGDGQSEIVVLQSDGQTFSFYGQAGGTWTLMGTLPLSGFTVGDFDLARIDGIAGHDLVLGISNGTKTYGLSWPGPVATELLSRTSPGFTENQVETITDHMGPGQDGFAWATRIPALGRWAILGVSSAGQQLPTFLETGDELVGMAAGNLNTQKDFAEDLVISLEDASTIYGFLNLSNQLGEAAFDAEEYSFSSDTGFSGINGETPPIVGDLDGSGIADLLIGNTGLETVYVHYDIDTTDYDPAENFESGGLSWDYVAGGFSDAWQFLGTHPDLNFPDYALVSGKVEVSPSGSLTGLNAAFWAQPSGANHFLADTIASCVPVQSESLNNGGYQVHEPIDTTSLSFQLENQLNLYVLELQPEAVAGVLPPPLRMGLGARSGDLTGGLPGQSGILSSSSLRFREGLGVDDLGKIQYDDPSEAFGADIIVEIGPVRRLRTPPGVPPRKPTTVCPPVPATQ